MKIYIAGPISANIAGADMAEKLRRFASAKEYFETRDHEACSPIEVLPECGRTPEECAATTKKVNQPPGQDGKASHSWECYMRHDLRELLTCDAIALLPGAEHSPGARLEHRLAVNLGMPVIMMDIGPMGHVFDVNGERK